VFVSIGLKLRETDCEGVNWIYDFIVRLNNGVMNRDSSVGIAIGYGLDSRGSVPGISKTLFSSPQRPYWLWGTGGSFSGGQNDGGVNLTTLLHLVLRSRMAELYPYSPIRLPGVVLD
jgi:hypothetical protein